MSTKRAIIIGAGPAGLTAAYELLQRTDITPVILERSGDIGGISKTVNYKGNRIDIGGHRFFSKSDRVMQWWLNILPIEPLTGESFTLSYQGKHRSISAADAKNADTEAPPSDKVMLVRRRLSRIYFLRKFFAYPIQLSLETLRKLGIFRTIGILISYVLAQIWPQKPEKSLQDFMINRFGYKLYLLFFKDYTEKVWGVPCDQISAEWGAQRIKGISIGKAILHAARSLRPKRSKENNDISQKGTETSLIEKFLYPRLGPGQLWEEVARQVRKQGAEVHLHQQVVAIRKEGDRIIAVETVNEMTGERDVYSGDYFFSTMPVKELIASMDDPVPANVKEVAAGLQYRDFITVGILLRKMSVPGNILPDTWIYIQERDVTVGRLQIFNNWSPFMVKDPSTVWIGMEYFCNTTDSLWKMPDDDIQALGVAELEKMGLATVADVLDSTVLRMEKTYPAYFGTYGRFEEIRQFTDQFGNLFLVGRNGMHKYNNSDHSMLTAMVAVDNIVAGILTKDNIWSINTEQEYHEEKKGGDGAPPPVVTSQAPVIVRRERPVHTAAESLTAFIFTDRHNRWFRWIAIIGVLIQFGIFKYFYPFAGFINGDSYSYLNTAYWNYDVNTYPIGYSRFLRFFSVFSTSDTVLVLFQYLLLEASLLYLVFALIYFLRPSKFVRIFLFILALFNPIFLYLANYVSSDALFTAISLLWFTQLIRLIYRPSLSSLIWSSVLLFICFTIRNNALFYPLLLIIALALSHYKIILKFVTLGLTIVLLAIFISFTSKGFYKLSGVREFSPFTGWQMVNNAMYAYKFLDPKDVLPVPDKYKVLDRMVRNYFDTTRHQKRHPEEMLEASTVYMWSPISPLTRYMNMQFTRDTAAGPVKKWAKVAPLYAEYGSFLIRKYPLTFARYYLWPNLIKYYTPPVEFLASYNTGIDSVYRGAITWFGYKSNKVRTRFKDLKVQSLSPYPLLAGTLNFVFVSAAIAFFVLGGAQSSTVITRALVLVASFWLINFAFSVFAAPIALRFQLFPIYVFLCFTPLLLDAIVRLSNVKS